LGALSGDGHLMADSPAARLAGVCDEGLTPAGRECRRLHGGGDGGLTPAPVPSSASILRSGAVGLGLALAMALARLC
jgi:hypothetical protein